MYVHALHIIMYTYRSHIITFTSWNWFFTAGNFGVVCEAYYTKANIETKVAIKTLKGDYNLLNLIWYSLRVKMDCMVLKHLQKLNLLYYIKIS